MLMVETITAVKCLISLDLISLLVFAELVFETHDKATNKVSDDRHYRQSGNGHRELHPETP